MSSPTCVESSYLHLSYVRDPAPVRNHCRFVSAILEQAAINLHQFYLCETYQTAIFALYFAFVIFLLSIMFPVYLGVTAVVSIFLVYQLPKFLRSRSLKDKVMKISEVFIYDVLQQGCEH
jgi:hypothetical protein